MNTIKFSIEFITPERAAEYLRDHARNRSTSQQVVYLIRDAVNAGKWTLTHQPIAFNADGSLFDGKHRMTGVSIANQGAWFVVARYSDAKHASDAMLVLDRGRVRAAGDTAEIIGLVPGSGRQHAAAANAVLRGPSGGSAKAPSHLDVLDVIKRDADDVTAVLSVAGTKKLGGVVVGAFAWMRPINPEKVDALLRTVCSGVGANVLEAAIMRVVFARNADITSGAMNRGALFLKVARGIEAHIDGEPLAKLQELRATKEFCERIERRRAAAGAK